MHRRTCGVSRSVGPSAEATLSGVDDRAEVDSSRQGTDASSTARDHRTLNNWQRFRLRRAYQARVRKQRAKEYRSQTYQHSRGGEFDDRLQGVPVIAIPGT